MYGTNSNNYYTSPTTTTSNVKVTSVVNSNSNETKEPEVINRVYIKASDLPDRVNSRNGI